MDIDVQKVLIFADRVVCSSGARVSISYLYHSVRKNKHRYYMHVHVKTVLTFPDIAVPGKSRKIRATIPLTNETVRGS